MKFVINNPRASLIVPIFIILVSVLTKIPTTQSANVLFYFGVSSYSHRIAVWPLVTALADRGHNVTFITIYKPKAEHKHPKIKEFLPKEFEDQLGTLDYFKFENLVGVRHAEGRFGTLKVASFLPKMGFDLCNLFLSTKATQDWIQHSQYDLVIIDALYNECGLGLAHKFGSKVIIFGTTSVFSWWHDAFGFPAETSWLPELHVSFPFPMNFGERALSTIMPIFQYYHKLWSYYPQLDTLFKDKFNDPNMPTTAELEKETSLILLSSHFSEEYARSLPPLIIPVGGIHLDKEIKKFDSSKIPMDMAKFIDEAGPAGFIYVSFGSAAMFAEAPLVVQQTFFTAFKNSKAKFLWKWEGERPKEMPSNVFTAKWMPQQQVLGHPKIKAFITHAGLMGLTEAITYAVPLLMFPLFAEQDYNSFRFEREKRGIRLEIATLTAPELEKALAEILTNPIYKENMAKTKSLYQDRPSSPLETAIWWTEYVLRHDDLKVLKPLSMYQTWYERRLLDVWGFLGGLFVLILILGYYLIKKLVCCLFCRSSSSSASSSSSSPSKSKGKSKAKKS